MSHKGERMRPLCYAPTASSFNSILPQLRKVPLHPGSETGQRPQRLGRLGGTGTGRSPRPSGVRRLKK